MKNTDLIHEVQLFYGVILTENQVRKGLAAFYADAINEGKINVLHENLNIKNKSLADKLDLEDALEFYNCYSNDRKDNISIWETGDPSSYNYAVYLRKSDRRTTSLRMEFSLEELTNSKNDASKLIQDWDAALYDLLINKFELKLSDFRLPNWHLVQNIYLPVEEE